MFQSNSIIWIFLNDVHVGMYIVYMYFGNLAILNFTTYRCALGKLGYGINLKDYLVFYSFWLNICYHLAYKFKKSRGLFLCKM